MHWHDMLDWCFNGHRLSHLILMLSTHLASVQTGDTALHVAAGKGHLRVVEMLLKANADVNIKANVRAVLYRIFPQLGVSAYSSTGRKYELISE